MRRALGVVVALATVVVAAVVMLPAGAGAVAAPSGVRYQVVTTCSTGAVTVRADATRVAGMSPIGYRVQVGAVSRRYRVDPGGLGWATVGGAEAIASTVTVYEGSVQVGSSVHATACPATAVPASKFVPLAPTRVLDTRPATRLGYAGAKPRAAQTVRLAVAGVRGIAADATAVVLNLTATEPTGPGFVRAFPTGRGAGGTSSNVNVERAGQTIANAAIVPVGADGSVSLFVSTSMHLVADVAGYFVPADSFPFGDLTAYVSTDGRWAGVKPTRVLDTRPATAVQYSGGKPAAGSVIEVPVVLSDAHPNVPVLVAGGLDWVGSVVLNVTATEAAAPGYVQVAPGGALVRGRSSNVNVSAAGQTIANLVVVPLSATGTVSIYTKSSSHLIVDVLGFFTDADAPNSISGLFRPLDPERVLDSRDASRVGGDNFDGAAKTMATLRFPGLSAEMGAVIMNVTATATGAPGYVQVGPNLFPDGLTIGSHSNLNVERAGQTIPNLVITTAAQLSDGASIYTLGPAELVADIFGWFTYSTTG